MGTPSIPHFGTTLYEATPPDGADLATLPFGGMLSRVDRFLTILGMERYVENIYGREVGRQYIYRRGQLGDLDYFEKDAFVSYSATFRPPAPSPRIGDVVFRVVHHEPRRIYEQLLAEDLVRPIGPEGEAAAFVAGERDTVLFRGPDEQDYELSPVGPTFAANHAIFIWTDPAQAARTEAEYGEQFELLPITGRAEDFHGVGRAKLLVRQEPPITIGLLTPNANATLLPRWTDDVFAEVGYSHFRLGSPRKAQVLERNREVFPATGDVAYVMFNEAYLELVQVDAAVPVGI